MHPIISNNLIALKTVLKSHKVTKAYVFGSVANGTFSSESDVDILVNFEDNIDPIVYSDNYFDLLFALQSLFSRNVDLVNERSLRNPYLIRSIEDSRKLIL
jgi:predicted nucleotidyltransferase